MWQSQHHSSGSAICLHTVFLCVVHLLCSPRRWVSCMALHCSHQHKQCQWQCMWSHAQRLFMQCDIRRLRNTVEHALPDRQTNRPTKKILHILLAGHARSKSSTTVQAMQLSQGHLSCICRGMISRMFSVPVVAKPPACSTK